jgi:hypothetical protein
MASRIKILLLAFVGVAVVSGIVQSQSPKVYTPEQYAAAERAALARTISSMVKKEAKDPDSVKFVSFKVDEAAKVACAEYRGKNSFGAVVKEYLVFVNGVGRPNHAATWDKHCTKTPLYDQMPLLR